MGLEVRQLGRSNMLLCLISFPLILPLISAAVIGIHTGPYTEIAFLSKAN